MPSGTGGPGAPGLHRVRDLLVLNLEGGRAVVIACDSAGGVGPKPDDAVAAPGYVVGRFTARVALMEILAGGASPVAVVNSLCVEPFPTGEEIARGVREEASLAGVDPEAAVTGSSEKNIPTLQTGLGVTVVALADPAGLRPGRAAPGDLVIAAGRPKWGNEVRLDDPEIADLELVRLLGSRPGVHDLLPVGSRGIAREARVMGESAGLRYVPLLPPGWDVAKSAGPSTCLLAAISPGHVDAAMAGVAQPWAVVGRLERV